MIATRVKMKTLSILAQKGGTGKTTLAVHLAVLAVETGSRVVLVDTDPQRSAADWWRERSELFPELVECETTQLPDVVKAAKADKVDWLIVDTAPHAEAGSAIAARTANLALIVTRPAILDLRAIGASVGVVKGNRAKGAIVLNACPPPRGVGEASITHEARRGLESYGLPICPVAISQRAAMSHALIDGRAVTEFEPDGKAAREIAALWNWIQGV